MKKAKAWWFLLPIKTQRQLCQEYFGHPFYLAGAERKSFDLGVKDLFNYHTRQQKRLEKEATSITKWLKTESINIRISCGRVTKKLNYGIDRNFHVISNGKTVLKTKDAVTALKKYESL